jgi:glycosyltransferase involved in cell wall biosynthesis
MSPAAEGRRPLLVVAESLPVLSTGTSIVLRRLLENFDGEEVVLIGRRPDPRLHLDGRPPHYPFYSIPALRSGIRGERYWRLLSTLPGIGVGMRAIQRHRPSALLAVFPYEHALLTGYWLHVLSGLPLLAYFCDLYLEDRGGGWEAGLARWLQPRVFKAAARILAANRGMVDYYRARYGFEALALPACINEPIPDPAPVPAPGGRFVIGYSGNVNSTRLDSLRALVDAVGGDPAYEIRYLTPQTPDFLRAQGVWADNATATFIADEKELVRQLSLCDVLFLPLTFEFRENSRDQLATCFGIKSYEYFLSQRPVLLHSPADYFIARFFHERDCGLVASEPGPEALVAALTRLRSDADLRARFVRNALAAAHEFEGSTIASTLRRALAGALDPVEATP